MTPEEEAKRKLQMKALIWRVLYAAICFVLFWWLLPLFLAVLGVHPNNALMQLIQAGTAALAILYVIFGGEPPYPW